jgi:hypothetical protein
MKRDNYVLVDGVNYSRLSNTLRFNVELGPRSIKMLEDIIGSKSSDMDAVAEELAAMIHRIILLDHSNGGMRRISHRD